MDKFIIEGGERLNGKVLISGSKNAVLPLLAATLLQGGEYRIDNVPRLRDVYTMIRLINLLGGETKWIEDHSIKIDTRRVNNHVAPYEIVKEMRASVLVLGSLIGGLRRATVSYPGGCAIGERPIDLHLKGLSALGCEVSLREGYADVTAKKLKGACISFDKTTVGGTENIIMAAVKAKGETIIENAACEPEIVDLSQMLKQMGAKIEGEGTEVIKVTGVDQLVPCNYSVIPDRIETGTFLVACGMTRGNIEIEDCVPSHVQPIIKKLREAGMDILESENTIKASMSKKRANAVDIRTAPYPGFPTDMQAQIMALMSTARGASAITETIFENRMMHAAELRRMGADIRVIGNTAIVKGVKMLTGAKVMATDLRASASLIIAGLTAYGTTEVSRIYHIDRGYESIEEKLRMLGAKIERRKDENLGS
ncbi:MAG TPA: UDP-N-acetylglucosamine 1-carboxyvinyltransferase [Syntrophorhabdaceae bacterium]|jgi:UDP-N-acetylglucosamine 1-carboxyvinyltransferase|nr:UDP-N-acetylglucosamine 1-carboxyvinyltransferase [Syntrophorhabdaceae bacterium]MDI9560935.1 UDP-N-acetylglucosamine 1-carboxyvinyltransferase [Pseudomonadota bacterium]MBP8697791.1 UDP-N-acetylglucosamine 1-carboxyvinyltransferase [Syntrophorhabdaceae bacterium]HNZ58347.1 UDP-N-acetylglucosamine 1-carboxyvinyltransferase [Syntrophorhabdaceae bacterium]HOG39030.1 UDP-N-acetylglucosamine 1-carboxyvinyltransferase [Syntrophorhabdaceae bacterium]